MKLTHVRLLVDDFGAAFRFYRDALGLEPTFGAEEGPYASFATGDAALSIFARENQAETVPDLGPPGDGALTVLEVDDVDATARTLGIPDPVSRPDWGIRVAYVRDPSGNLLEVCSRIPVE